MMCALSSLSRLQSAEKVLPRFSKLSTTETGSFDGLRKTSLGDWEDLPPGWTANILVFFFELMVSPITEQLTFITHNTSSSISIESLIIVMSSAYPRSYKGSSPQIFLWLLTNSASWVYNTFSPQPGNDCAEEEVKESRCQNISLPYTILDGKLL